MKYYGFFLLACLFGLLFAVGLAAPAALADVAELEQRGTEDPLLPVYNSIKVVTDLCTKLAIDVKGCTSIASATLTLTVGLGPIVSACASAVVIIASAISFLLKITADQLSHLILYISALLDAVIYLITAIIETIGKVEALIVLKQVVTGLTPILKALVKNCPGLEDGLKAEYGFSVDGSLAYFAGKAGLTL